jgi:cytochrome c oxidase cbb3-type subunit III
MKALTAVVFALALILSGCEREKRVLRAPDADENSQAGSAYERRAYDVSNGKQLFFWFNCNGCHANGGGDAGPALMDDKWIYGSSIEAIASSIREGRPRGMPSFKDKATEDQIWKLAAYVRSLASQVPSDTAPARNDDMRPHEPESRLPASHPTGDARIQVKP